MPFRSSPSRLLSTLRRALLVGSVFLAIWGVTLSAISRYGSDLPYWDSWGKEGELLFQRWYEDHTFWSNLLIPHNEHRIGPTLVLSFGLLYAGGEQWDARVQCVASAALHAALIAGLVAWALRRFDRRWALATAVVAVIISAPPIVTENVLGGFQTQFYFLEIFSVLGLGALLMRPAFSAAWLAGVVSVAIACVSMGSGFLVAAPLAAIAIWRLLTGENRRDAWAVLAVAVLTGVIGVYFRPQAPWHAPMHAHNLGEFITYAARCLSWPLYGSPWLAPVVWLPWLALAGWRIARFRRATGELLGIDFVLASGAWVLVQIAAVTYSRGGGSVFPAVRYGDVSALGLVFNVLAAGLLAQRLNPRTIAWSATAWAAVLAVMMGLGTNDAIHGNLASKRRENLEYEKNVRAFILTDDYETFSKQELPFPSPEWLRNILHRPSIRRILPASVREPIHVEGLAGPRGAAPVLANRATHTVAAPGEWKSAPLPAGQGWWKFETAGDIGQPGVTVALVSVRTGQVLRTIAPTKPAGNSWRAAYVPAPNEPAVLLVRASSRAQWVGVSEPIEMSTLSYRTWRLSTRGTWLAVAGVLGLVLVGATWVFGERTCVPDSDAGRQSC